MLSEALPLSVRSAEDVQITIYDASGLKQKVRASGEAHQDRPGSPPGDAGIGAAVADVPPGLYRVRLDRCSFVSEHVIHHSSPAANEFPGPELESPVPIDITRGWARDADLARRLSAPGHESLAPIGGGSHDARLCIFIRHMTPSAARGVLPSEPISLHDMSGALLRSLADPDDPDRDAGATVRVVSCRIASGSYRLRVGRARRDLALTIPAGRAAHVFLADHGSLSLRSARISLPVIEAEFDPHAALARAMESALWALGRPQGELPPIAGRLLSSIERDPIFGIACAHLVWRRRERESDPALRRRHGGELGAIVRKLVAVARDLPDVAILAHALGDLPARDLPPLDVIHPPVFRASLVLAIDAGARGGGDGAFEHATRTGYQDSVWCTWSLRWWDELWIEPTVEQLIKHSGGRIDAAQISKTTRLPIAIVERAIERLAAGLPRVQLQPVAVDQISIPGYTLRDVVGRSRQSAVVHAQRHDSVEPKDVAIKLIPTSSAGDADRLLREARAVGQLRHKHLLRLERWDVLPADAGHGVWLEVELCRDSLFDRMVARGAPMPVEDACTVVVQALDALDYLHAHGVQHGRIHPGEVLLRGDGTAALGLPAFTHAEHAGAPGSGRDPDGAVMRFMAPELVLDPAAVSVASDVWSLAATLYFALTLELPRERESNQDERSAALGAAFVPICRRSANVPAALAACIDRALSPATGDERRFQHAGELRRALLDAMRSDRMVADATALRADLVRGDPDYEATLRTMFLRMSAQSVGGVVPRWVSRDDLVYASTPENQRVEVALQRFRKAGLLATRLGTERESGATYIAPTHDALASDWPAIRHWHDDLASVPGAHQVLAELEQAGARALAGETPVAVGEPSLKVANALRRDARFTYNQREERILRQTRAQRASRQRGIAMAGLAMLGIIGVLLWLRRGETADAQNTQATLARSLQDTGRQQLLYGRAFGALPYLLAAREAAPGHDADPALRMLFHAASRRLSTPSALEHAGAVRHAVFSPAGAQVLTASADTTARVWDATTGKPVAKLQHDGAVVSAAWSRDGKWLVTASEDGTAQIWDAVSGQAHGPRLRHDDFVESVAFSPDGARVVTASLDHTARIWSLKGVLEHRLEHADAVWSAVFSSDGKLVVTASRDRSARIWSATSGEPVGGPLEHRGDVKTAAFSLDATRVITGSQDATARVWSVATGKPVAPALVHRDGVTSAAFDPSGRYVVTASFDGNARVWNAENGAPMTPWLEHQGSVTSAMFSADGGTVVTASADHTARIWDARTGRLFLPLLEHTGPVAYAAYSSDGKRVVTASFDGTARIWDAMDQPAVPLAQGDAVAAAAFDPDGKRVATVGQDGAARVWDAATGALTRELGSAAPVRTVSFSPDGSRIVTSGEDRRVRIWDVATGGMRELPFELAGQPAAVVFSADGGRIIATRARDAARLEDVLREWDVTTGAELPLALSLGPSDRIVEAALSGDGMRIVAIERDRTARVWSGVTGRPVTPPLEHALVARAAFSADGRYVVTIGDDHAARVWDASTAKAVSPALGRGELVTAALLSRDGTRCATVGADWTARIWEVATGKQLARPLLHDSPVVSAAFTDDGTRIVTIDRHAVRTWDVALDTRSLKQWSDVAGRSPYVYWRGVLMLRSAAAGMTDDSEPDDEPSGSFFEPAQGLGELDPRNFFGTRDDEVDRPQP